jgi:lipopolysaccharide export system protein LptA
MPYPAAFAELLKTPELLSQNPPALTQSAPPSAFPPSSEAVQPIRRDGPSSIPASTAPPPIEIFPNPYRPNAQPPSPETPASTISPTVPSVPLPSAIQPLAADGMIELKADRQTYDDRRQIFIAEGNVFMRFRDSRVKADRLQVNLVNRFAVAEGNVTFVKGAQVLQGDRFEYNFVQGNGSIRGAKGEIATQSTQDFTDGPLSTDVSASSTIGKSISDRIYRNQPATGIDSRIGSELVVGSDFSSLGQQGKGGRGYRRLRFEADSAEFFPDGWDAKNIRITNDPFSPPELELRARSATSRKRSIYEDEILLDKPQLVFDQRFKLPIPRNRILLDKRPKKDVLRISPGYDDLDRGGFYIERGFTVVSSPNFYLDITPEFYIQRAFSRRNVIDWFGTKATVSANLGRTQLNAALELTSLDLTQFEQRFRGNLQLLRPIGTHTLALQGAYRQRLFNNSLGFQDVQSTIGGILYSPNIALWDTGINLSYQLGYQYINADTDRADLLKPVRTNNRISLSRYQAAAALSRSVRLWQGIGLPPTQYEGMRYTPAPVVPYLDLILGTTAVASAYGSGDNQDNVTFSAGFNAQLGHFSKPVFDYTALNLTYSQALRTGSSPFLFDRVADGKILAGGITQQIYGPIRAGFQTAWNVDTAKEISTDYFLEYSRRTYNLRLRYNPILSLGSINLVVSDFNWDGGSEGFKGTGVVSNGVSP